MIFEHTICWHACQGHRAIITSKSSFPYLKEKTNVCKKPCLQEAILWGFHLCQEIAETNVQVLDLVTLLVTSENSRMKLIRS